MTKKVNVFVKTQNGEWVLAYEDIDEAIAIEIWKAGFKTGENRISIEDEESRRIKEINRRSLSTK